MRRLLACKGNFARIFHAASLMVEASMLIDFTVNNFRSIRDAITLSSVAQARKSPQTLPPSRRNIKPDHKIAPTFSVEGRDIELLPVIGIFGANASGKSN